MLFFIPLIGWIAWLWGHVPIDRGNLKRAVRSLDSLEKQVIEYNLSIGISPEGKRSNTGGATSLLMRRVCIFVHIHIHIHIHRYRRIQYTCTYT